MVWNLWKFNFVNTWDTLALMHLRDCHQNSNSLIPNPTLNLCMVWRKLVFVFWVKFSIVWAHSPFSFQQPYIWLRRDSKLNKVISLLSMTHSLTSVCFWPACTLRFHHNLFVKFKFHKGGPSPVFYSLTGGRSKFWSQLHYICPGVNYGSSLYTFIAWMSELLSRLEFTCLNQRFLFPIYRGSREIFDVNITLRQPGYSPVPGSMQDFFYISPPCMNLLCILEVHFYPIFTLLFPESTSYPSTLIYIL